VDFVIYLSIKTGTTTTNSLGIVVLMLGAYALAHLGRRLPGLKGVHMKRAKNHALMQLNIATEKMPIYS
jgi:hypothetical protein